MGKCIKNCYFVIISLINIERHIKFCNVIHVHRPQSFSVLKHTLAFVLKNCMISCKCPLSNPNISYRYYH